MPMIHLDQLGIDVVRRGARGGAAGGRDLYTRVL